jgi:polyhydroxybutyrate depolymerase
LVVYPDGYKHFWNECRKFSTAAANKEDINEQAFFTAMIQYFTSKYGISKQRIFAGGFSGGGHMAYKLAMTMPEQIKAIEAVVANMPDSASCDCALAGKALPVLIINGTDDKTNPYNGGEMFVNNSSFGVVRSSENTFAYWAGLAGYKGTPEKKLLPDTDTADHKIIESYSYHSAGKPPVTLLKVVGGHHDYPGDIDVYLYAWNFFKGMK